MVEVREAQPAEFDDAGRVTYEAYAALPGEHMDDDYAVELRDAGRRAAEAVLLVALDAPAGLSGGRVVGSVTYVPDSSSPWAEDVRPGEAAIRMLAVDPSVQGKGIGGALTAACIERARAAGKQAVVLHSTPWMTAAHRIYERAGFVRVPERDWLPLPNVPLLAFRLDLAG